AIGKFRLSITSVDQPDLGAKAIPDGVLAAIRKEASARSAGESQSVAAYYRTVAPELEYVRERVAGLQTERSVLLGSMPKTLVTEATEPHTIRILPRGNW